MTVTHPQIIQQQQNLFWKNSLQLAANQKPNKHKDI